LNGPKSLKKEFTNSAFFCIEEKPGGFPEKGLVLEDFGFPESDEKMEQLLLFHKCKG